MVLSWRAKAVAGPISTHMDGNGRKIRPSIDLLAADSGLASRTVATALAELREAGFLIVEKQGGGRANPTLYRAAIPRITVHQMHGLGGRNGAPDAFFCGRNDARYDRKP